MRMNLAGELALFGRHRIGFAAVLDHLAHLADTLGALRSALVLGENFARTRGARLDGAGHIPLAKTVTVTDVHGRNRAAIDNGSL